MFFEDETINDMLKVQDLDKALLKVKKQFDELPQRQAILEARQNKAKVEDKLKQVEAMKADVDKRVAKVITEDTVLARKQEEVQEAITAAGSDYRNLEARTKELDGHAKRRAALATQLEDLDKEQAKVADLMTQVQGLLQRMDRVEQKEIDSFRKEGGALQNAMAALKKERDGLFAKLPADAAKEYAKTAAACGGVAIGLLAGSACGVCRTPFDETRLVNVRSQAPVSRCPHCKRMLVVTQN